MTDSTLDYDRCIEAADQALARGDRVTGERLLLSAISSLQPSDHTHVERAAALIRLGLLRRDQSDLPGAEALFREALELGEASLGPDDPRLVSALTSLGATLVERGAPEQAEPLLTRALAISESHLGADHPDLAVLLIDLARLYLKQTAYLFAEPMLLRLLAMKRKKGEDHPEVATVLASLAVVRQALGRHEAAEQLWRRVLEIREHTLAPNHFSLVTTLEHLAEACAARGKTSEALRHLQRAQAIRALTLGSSHASMRASRERIADLQLQAEEESLAAPDLPVSGVAHQSHGLTAMEYLSLPTPVAARPVPVSVDAPMPLEGSAANELVVTAHATAEASLPEPRTELSDETGPRELALTAAEPTMTARDRRLLELDDRPSALAPYAGTLLAMREEIGDSERSDVVTDGRAAALLASASDFLESRRTAAITTTIVIVLLLGTFAMRSDARTEAGSERVTADERARAGVGSAPMRLDSATAATAPASPAPSESFAAGAASAANAVLARLRPSEDRTTTRRIPEARAVEATNGIPAAPRAITLSLDSVRGLEATTSAIPDVFTVQQAAVTATPSRGIPDASESTGSSVRARLIGSVPAPRYPDRLLSKVYGEVRVRFTVDMDGRTVMSSFTPIRSPHPLLTGSVREVVADLRFEPARMEGPYGRLISDVVEISFQFAKPER